MQIKKQTLDFLKDLAKNNNKVWFTENKPRYVLAKENMEEFVGGVKKELDKTDAIDRVKIYRIYRDVRFSKDKTPYKKYLHAALQRLGADRRGGYYFGIEPGNSGVGGGFYAPNKDDLLRIRKEFSLNPEPIQEVLGAKKLKSYYGELLGDGVKTTPRGFDKEVPNLDLVRKKQFYFMKTFTDKEVLSKDFFGTVVDGFQTIRPYFDYMSEVLTTDLNGESIL